MSKRQYRRGLAGGIDRGYEPVRRALSDEAERLGRLVTANLDTARALPPARPAVEAAVLRRAEAIVAGAETVLLRAAERSARQVHVRQIAAAVDSSKVLPRSG